MKRTDLLAPYLQKGAETLKKIGASIPFVGALFRF